MGKKTFVEYLHCARNWVVGFSLQPFSVTVTTTTMEEALLFPSYEQGTATRETNTLPKGLEPFNSTSMFWLDMKKRQQTLGCSWV